MPPQTWMLLSPVLVALAAALAALVADALGTPSAASRTAAVGLAVAGGLFAFTAAQSPGTVAGGIVAVGGTYAIVDALLCGLAAVALAAADRRGGGLRHAGQVGALVAFSTAASTVLLGAFDLVVFLVALELIALAGYALVAAARTPRAYEAAMKYFVQGAVATGLLVYGVAVLFGISHGATRFDALQNAVAAAPTAPATVMALVLMVSAVAFKLGAFPFHSWAPDAYETAPAPVAAFLASVPKLAALFAAMLVVAGIFGPTAVRADGNGPGPAMLLVAGLSAASIAFGNLAALRQTSFRRMLGYSGIAQIGYALAGLVGMTGAAGGVRLGMNWSAVFTVLVFGMFYALAAMGAFLAAEAADEGQGWDGTVAALAGLGRRRPVLAASLAVCLLSLTGIPLTAGFWGKFLVFASASSSMLWLAVVGVLGSVVSFGYYGGVLRAVYLDETAEAPEPAPGLEEAPAADEVGELLPRSVGAMAADDPAEAKGGGTWAVAVIAVLLLAAGIAPLFTGAAGLVLLAR